MLKAAPLLALVLTTTLASCASRGDEERFAYVEEPVEKLYGEGAEQLERKRYEEAIAYFAEVERQHPYSAWARRAMLMTAYAQYRTNDYEDSIASIERFLAIHPGNKDAAYAYYLKAMNFYERIRDVGRDQDITRNALTALEDVIRRYPESEYARDARLKIDLTRDHLAGKEMDVGRWYLREGQLVAALGRFNTVIEQYQTTSQVPEALHRSVEAYLQLGIVPEAKRYAALLGHNFPDSAWYRDTYRLFESRDLQLVAESPKARPELPSATPAAKDEETPEVSAALAPPTR
ncbi:outer membrane protein assembly factor BamD [Parvularcula dongshanensis]|uniref:Outer membrane protein assembly factor BamD n=1 Tax=Parvularcula dongshanensis TaxID=1173995 RepID=A0A840I2C2_9PROT|nr:outer membrane protein assembly factor BamD [Parvularcula dongshanensis]MBB4658442.1 outer membrane protein assembly factor BamD [Parvularcula dongshanensis]